MPDVTTHQTTPSTTTVSASSRYASLKWGIVLAALLAAIVWDGIATFKTEQVASDRSPTLATITYPADRCGPDCAIMVASEVNTDQTGSIERPH
jgi:hypothetical protein